MPNELKNLTLTELSLVDTPANPLAMAPVWKSINSDGEAMTDDIEKMSEKERAKLKPYMDQGMNEQEAREAYQNDINKEKNDMTKSLEEEVEALKAENEKLRKSLLDEGFRITAEGVEKKAPEEFVEYDGEKILKSDIPAPILKRLEEAEVEKAEAAVTKKAQEELPNFELEVAKALVKADFSEEIMQALKAADALFDGLTKEVGKSGASGDMTDPAEQIQKYAKENNLSVDKAYAQLAKTAEGRALISKVYEAKKDA